jgi:HAD superfamily hydrolase (TIGR01450 family)
MNAAQRAMKPANQIPWEPERMAHSTSPSASITPLHEVEAFLLDMDGTLYLGTKPIAGARECLEYLRATGRRLLFFTNNPTRDAAQYVEKLRGLGMAAAPEDVLTAGEATVRYLQRETTHRKLYVLGNPSFEAEVDAAGFIRDGAAPDAVVLAFDTTLTYAKLERACALLADGLPYYATNPDRVCPTEAGFIPDCGAMAALLEAATGRTPQYIGKPYPAMVRMGMQKLNARKTATAMVGDRLYTDMEMAYRAEITSVLVLSGETTREALNAEPRKPDYVFPSLAGLHAHLQAEDRARA